MIIDTSLIVGILIIGVLIANTFVDQPQRKWVNDKFDDLTIWLDEAKPVKWFSRLATPKGQVILLTIGSIEFLILTIPSLISSFLYYTAAPNERVRQIILLVIMLVFLPLTVKKIGPRITSWLFGDGRVFRFLLKWIALVIAGTVGVMLYLLIALILISVFGSRDAKDIDQPAIAMAFVPVFPLIILYWVLTQVGVIVAIVALILFILELLLKISRPIAWYISFHVTRPYLILTGTIAVLLEFINLYLSHVKK